MRIYEGSPRQDWEEVLRSIGAWADREVLKELLFLELDGGFLVQGIHESMGGQWSEAGTVSKQTHELTDDQVGDLIGEAKEQRDAAGADHAEVGVANFYEQALRIIGKWLDSVQPARRVLLRAGWVVRGPYVHRRCRMATSATSCPNSPATKSWL